MTETAAADEPDDLKKLAEEVKKLREAIEARPPVIYPQPIYVPVVPPPYTVPWYIGPTWTISTTGPIGPNT